MEIQRKTVSGHLVKSDAEGSLEAVVSVFGNVDSYGERCMLGCFDGSIAKKLPKGVWMHDWSRPVAKTLEARELAPYDPMLPDSIKENGGLYIRAQFFKDIPASWEAFRMIQEEMVDEYSIGYRNLKKTKDPDTNIVDLIELDLYEWSPVLKGANPATATISVKSMLADAAFGCDLEEHTDLLLKRWDDRLKARDADGSLNPAFVNRLKEAAAKLTALIPSDDQDSEEMAPTLKSALEWEQLCHAHRLRQIRG